MTNFIQDGETIEYANAGSAITSGSVVVIGTLVGIAATDIAATTGVATVCLEGVFKVTKKAPLVITQGDLVYWAASPGEVTKTNTDALMGTAHVSALSGDITIDVRLKQG